jgi:histidinol-phosphate aminotransferase
VVLRTFSKAFGLAGLRVGYGIASYDLQEQLSDLMGPYPVSNIGLDLAFKSLDQWPQILLQLNRLKIKVKAWQNLINLSADLFSYPTETNFLLLKTNDFNHPLLQDPEINKRLRRFSGTFGQEFTRLTIDLNLKDPTWNN